MSSEDAAPTMTPDVVGELLGLFPRLVDRTRSQAEFARALASMLPCVGGLLPSRPSDDIPAGEPERERVDVLSVLADDGSESTPDSGLAAPETTSTSAAHTVPVPAEVDLPIQDYDSLAASQVVPRLSTLDHADLLVVQSYESANRRRQTILHRVEQLLAP